MYLVYNLVNLHVNVLVSTLPESLDNEQIQSPPVVYLSPSVIPLFLPDAVPRQPKVCCMSLSISWGFSKWNYVTCTLLRLPPLLSALWVLSVLVRASTLLFVPRSVAWRYRTIYPATSGRTFGFDLKMRISLTLPVPGIARHFSLFPGFSSILKSPKGCGAHFSMCWSVQGLLPAWGGMSRLRPWATPCLTMPSLLYLYWPAGSWVLGAGYCLFLVSVAPQGSGPEEALETTEHNVHASPALPVCSKSDTVVPLNCVQAYSRCCPQKCTMVTLLWKLTVWIPSPWCWAGASLLPPREYSSFWKALGFLIRFLPVSSSLLTGLFLSFSPWWPYWPPLLFLKHTGVFLPQDLCTCFPLCLECSSSRCLLKFLPHQPFISPSPILFFLLSITIWHII